MDKASSTVKRRISASLVEDIKKKWKALIISAVSFIFGALIVQTLSVAQKLIEPHLGDENAKISIQPVSSAIAVFECAESEIVFQIMEYRISASDLTRDIKITAIFPQETKIKACYVTYNVDLKGFKQNMPQRNHLRIELDHSLDFSKVAHVYLCTERKLASGEDLKFQNPDIHVEGISKDGTIVYQ